LSTELTVADIAIRRGTVQDAERVSSLVTALAVEFIVDEFTPEGRAYFLREHSPAAVRERIAGDFRFYLAEDGNDLVAVAAIRGNTHLYYLFVSTPYQGSGLARRLWSQVQADAISLGNPGSFTVNASNFAVAVYEKLGFRRVEPTQERNGVLYNPMHLVRSS
jgi:ribosomal protein S18 acetylase RimI-like enzyme